MSNTLKTALASLALAAAICLVGYRTVTKLNEPGKLDDSKWGMCDFRDAVYYPVVALLDGRNPYNSETYVKAYPARFFPLYWPLALIIHLPFGLLPFQWAELAYFWLTIALVVALARMSLTFCGLEAKPHRVLGLAAMILLSRPGQVTVMIGQVSLQATLATMAALHYAKRRPGLSGLALALSTFKPTFGVPLAWFMWCRRDYRAVLTGLAFSIVASLPLTCILIRSEGGMRNFVEAVASNHAKTSSLVAPSASPPVDAYTTLARFAGWSNGGLVEPAVMLLCLAVVGCAIGRVARRTTLDGADGWSGACIVLAILVSVHHCPYDALLLALPLTAIAAARRQPWRSMNAKLRWCLFGVTMVVAANYLASESVSKMLGLRGALLTMAASANGLALLVSLAACIALGPFPAKKPPVERMQPTSCCPLTLALSPLRKTPGGEGIPPPNLLREASGPDAVLGCRARDLLDGRKSCSLRLLPRELITKTGPVDHARWNYRPLLGRIERRRFQLAKSMLSDAPYGRLLELGYGSGVFLPELARHGGELFGLDIHPHADQVAAALGQISVRAQLSSGSADRLPYASACFDCVVAVSTLEFIEDLSAASREISRVLKPDGEFVVVTPGFSRLVDLGLKLLTGKSARADFSDRRQRVIATLLEHFEAISHRTCPRLAPSSLTLYHALKLRPLPAQSPPRCSD